MFTNPDVTLTLALSGLVALAMVALAGLKGLSIWAGVRREELTVGRAAHAPAAGIASRIELADLKERLRKLEAIADGVEL